MIAAAVTTENQVKMRILSAIVHRTLRLLQIFKKDTMMSAAVTAVVKVKILSSIHGNTKSLTEPTSKFSLGLTPQATDEKWTTATYIRIHHYWPWQKYGSPWPWQ